MEIENERKFILSKRPDMDYLNFRVYQGYLHISENEEIRIRKSEKIPVEYVITQKIGGISQIRQETEFSIPEEIFNILWESCCIKRMVKHRYLYGNYVSIDIFDNGLILAEKEYHEGDDISNIPDIIQPLIIKEVTTDPNYYSQNLAQSKRI